MPFQSFIFNTSQNIFNFFLTYKYMERKLFNLLDLNDFLLRFHHEKLIKRKFIKIT